MSTLLQDITSGDAHKIWASSCAIIYLRDPHVLDMLSSHLSEIQETTRGIALSGAFFPNSKHLNFAICKLDYHKNKRGCLCRLYPDYSMYDPKQEEKEGNVRVFATSYLEGGWIDAYTCTCALCGTEFRVEEREYHYTWWGWEITAEGN